MTETSPSVVRIAQPADESSVLELCRLLHEENGAFSISQEKVDELVQCSCRRVVGPNTPQPPIIGVIGPSAAAEAAICMTLAQIWYSDDWHLGELFNFVHPGFRRSRHAQALIAFAKETADRIGIPLLTGIVSNTRTEAKVRLYERQLPKAGAFFMYGAQTGRADPAAVVT